MWKCIPEISLKAVLFLLFCRIGFRKLTRDKNPGMIKKLSEKKRRQKRWIVAAVIALIVVCIAAGLLYVKFKPGTTEGAKEVKITVVHGDGEEKEFTYHTDREYLGEVLQDNELIAGEESDYGLYILTVDGETADEAKQQWWCITKAGEMVNTSADSTPIQDKEQYELTLKEGY